MFVTFNNLAKIGILCIPLLAGLAHVEGLGIRLTDPGCKTQIGYGTLYPDPGHFPSQSGEPREPTGPGCAPPKKRDSGESKEDTQRSNTTTIVTISKTKATATIKPTKVTTRKNDSLTEERTLTATTPTTTTAPTPVPTPSPTKTWTVETKYPVNQPLPSSIITHPEEDDECTTAHDETIPTPTPKSSFEFPNYFTITTTLMHTRTKFKTYTERFTEDGVVATKTAAHTYVYTYPEILTLTATVVPPITQVTAKVTTTNPATGEYGGELE